jgi:hypothetical protein
VLAQLLYWLTWSPIIYNCGTVDGLTPEIWPSLFSGGGGRKCLAMETRRGCVKAIAALYSIFAADDCRYAIYDFNYETPEGGQRNKLIFFVWAPDTAKIKKKMLVWLAHLLFFSMRARVPQFSC